jgi:hypothetical protein
LGGQDKDAEYISRGDPNTDAQKSQNRRPISTSTITGADEESIYDETPDISGEPSSAPLTMHGSVRRKPTLVHREPIARSREGLFAEYATGEIATIEGGNKDDDLEPVTPGTESQVHRATSVHFGGRGHARKVSAGSAKLLDLPPSRRQSMSPVETKRASSASLSKMAWSPSNNNHIHKKLTMPHHGHDIHGHHNAFFAIFCCSHSTTRHPYFFYRPRHRPAVVTTFY